jgi:diguanylate cyclase (GGDEF)-like protein
VKRASLLWRAPADREVMQIVRSRGLGDEVVRSSRIRLGEPVAGLVAQQCEPLLVGDITRHAEFGGARRGGYSSLSFVSVPILSAGQAVGVLNATEKEDGAAFSERDLSVLVGFAAHIRECAESEEREALAREQARTDPLTGLLNRRALEEQLEQEIARAKRTGRTSCLLMIDLDEFKAVNDTYGHSFGDRVLVEIGGIFKNEVRPYDLVFRQGGDEFAVLVPGASLAVAGQIARRIQRAVANAEWNGGTVTRPIGMSVGITCLPGESATVAQALARADAALYANKGGER